MRGPKPIEMSGRRYGRLLVVSHVDKPAGVVKGTYWLCRCDCGREKIIDAYALRSGATQSCGCLQRERAASYQRSHGMTGSPEYRSWAAMLTRCSNPRVRSYRDYGARGIRVDPRWTDFGQFLADVGPRPSLHHTLERRDNDGNYEPGNVYWGDRLEQANNKRNNVRLTYLGITRTLPQWARLAGISTTALRYRITRGLSMQDALRPTLRNRS